MFQDVNDLMSDRDAVGIRAVAAEGEQQALAFDGALEILPMIEDAAAREAPLFGAFAVDEIAPFLHRRTERLRGDDAARIEIIEGAVDVESDRRQPSPGRCTRCISGLNRSFTRDALVHAYGELRIALTESL